MTTIAWLRACNPDCNNVDDNRLRLKRRGQNHIFRFSIFSLLIRGERIDPFSMNTSASCRHTCRWHNENYSRNLARARPRVPANSYIYIYISNMHCERTIHCGIVSTTTRKLVLFALLEFTCSTRVCSVRSFSFSACVCGFFISFCTSLLYWFLFLFAIFFLYPEFAFPLRVFALGD